VPLASHSDTVPGMAAVLREIVIDCNDPRRVAEFWGQVLGWQLQEHRGVLWMSESGDWRDLGLVFVPVPGKKSAKNRIHLDVSPVGCDRDDEVTRLVALGARPVDVGQGDAPWVVLSDPEGNEFCVLGRRDAD
jgi:Glyoxalase-like domain